MQKPYFCPMKDTKQHTHTWLLIAGVMILVAAFSRLLPHPPNFTPIGGMALFAGAVFQRYRFSWMVPFLALWLSDLALNNFFYAHYYDGFRWFSHWGVLLAFALIFLMGRVGIRRWSGGRILALSLAGSVLFFLITNLLVWAGPMSIYTRDLSGLMASYIAGIPFFWNTLAGDLFYNSVLFGGWYLINQRQASLRLV
jgi:hypothetical protein